MWTDQVGSHLFEVLLQTADSETFDNLSTRCMLKMLVSLSIHPIANFLVQTLLRCLNKRKKVCLFLYKTIIYESLPETFMYVGFFIFDEIPL